MGSVPASRLQRGTMVYSYFSSSKFDTQKLENSRSGAIDIGEFRLNPHLQESDSLIYLNRRPILTKWLTALPGNNLALLDVGGRIQPYRPLVQGKVGRYVAIDLQMEGLVDVVANGEQLPFKDGSFDVVLCSDALQYIPDAPSAVTEMHRVLRPIGTLLLATRGCYPEDHSEYWRFIPSGLRYLTRMFGTCEIVPEGRTGSGLAISVNTLLHRDITTPWAMRLARRTTTPLINQLGLLLDRFLQSDSRSSCSYSLRARKRPTETG